VDQYDTQMRLYALALHRSGRAAVVQGSIQVHLALLHLGRVQTLRFTEEELEKLAAMLEAELRQMDEYGG